MAGFSAFDCLYLSKEQFYQPAGAQMRRLLCGTSKETRMTTKTVLPFPVNRLPKPASVPRLQRSPSPREFRDQLRRIFSSSGFAHAPRMRQFLEFVVEETLAGRAHRLCEYGVGVSVYGRNECFNPGLDPIVRNDARRLRHKLAEYYWQLNGRYRNQIRIEIPKGGYVPVFTPLAAQGTPGEQYHLSVTLVRTADGAPLWNATYDLPGEGGALPVESIRSGRKR
jgi:hypothetical protein